jgi:hypothetical protein
MQSTKLQADQLTAFIQAAAGDQRYGSMLSSFLHDLLAGKFGSAADAWAWVMQYAKDHWWPTPPVPPVATASGVDPLHAQIAAAIEAHTGTRKMALPVGMTMPELIDWLVTLIRNLAASKEVDLAIINFLLATVVPAIKAQGGYLAILVVPAEVWLRNKKAELEAANQPA